MKRPTAPTTIGSKGKAPGRNSGNMPGNRAALEKSGPSARLTACPQSGIRLIECLGKSPATAAFRTRPGRWTTVAVLAGLFTLPSGMQFGPEGAGASAVEFVAEVPARPIDGQKPASLVQPVSFAEPLRHNFIVNPLAVTTDPGRHRLETSMLIGTTMDSLRKTTLDGGAGKDRDDGRQEAPGATEASSGSGLEVGDKLKIVFYERVDDSEKNKWNRAASPGFQQRTEFTGEYAVQDGGTISLPLLGTFEVDNLSLRDLQSTLATSFEQLTGRKGFVTVLSLERPPVYVLGPVKNPGPYKYVPGMTILHAIALAGGFDRQNVEPWQRVEAVREVEKRRGAIETMLKALARDAVLTAERDGTPAKVPPRLLQVASEAEARRLLAEEIERRYPIVAARRNREQAISASLQAAQQEVKMLADRLQPIDGLITLREKRASAMQNLLQRGTISNLVAAQAQSELVEAEQRRREIVSQYAMAKQRAALAEQEQAKFQSDTRAEIEHEIAAAEQLVAANEREFATSDGVLGALRATSVQYTPSEKAGFGYEIVRQQGATGPVALTAEGMSTLRPGDLVNVVSGNERRQSDPGPQPARSAPGSSADKGRIMSPGKAPVREISIR